MYAIEVKDLKKQYDEIKAVDGISFQVEKGELFGFLGVNGAGKSTTINMLCTLFPPTHGKAYIFGKELGKEDKKIREDIGVVYQKDCLDELLSVKDNLKIRGSLYCKNKEKLLERLQYVSDILKLEEILDRPFGKLSGGQKRRCEIARALMHEPKILFLDEPTTGLDPATRETVWECIHMLRKQENMSVFLTTHYMEEAAKANHIAIIDRGKIKEKGTPFELKTKYAKDKLILYPSNIQSLEQYFKKNSTTYDFKDGILYIELAKTLDAIALINDVKPWIQGLEIIQGSMDDVFLNVTGKSLKGDTK